MRGRWQDWRVIASCVLLGIAPAAVSAQVSDYPRHAIHFIVPFPPGGPTDVVARSVSQHLAERLGQPVVIDNVAGAGGSIGMTSLARAAADGYTIGLATTGTHAVNPHLYGAKLQYDALKDFTAISPVVTYVNLLVVNPSLPINSVEDLVNYAKAHPVTFGSSGNGSTNHLSGELLTSLTGTPMTHIPYKGGAPALTDLLAGNITFMFDLLSSSMPNVKAGKLRALAVTSAKRTPFAPDVPTMDESGVPGYSDAGSDLWFGIVGPARMPAPIVDRLNAELTAILRSPPMQEQFRQLYLEVRTGTSSDFGATIAADYAKWGKVVRASGARID
jgi:tripartite-type tricarboxylate transporter receptor subunit TctC